MPPTEIDPHQSDGSDDIINRPAHYCATGVEPIVAIEAWGLGFNLGNTVKYIARAERKGTPLQDLKKAQFYLNREIANRQATG